MLSRSYSREYEFGKVSMLVPMADMANHQIPENAEWGYSEEKQSFYMRALERIKKGQEIYVNYGSHITNLGFFYQYGWI